MKVMRLLTILLVGLALFTANVSPVKASSPPICSQVAESLIILDKVYPKELNHTDLLNAAIKGLEEKFEESHLGKIDLKSIGASETNDKAMNRFYTDEVKALNSSNGRLTQCDLEFAATEKMLYSVNDSHVGFLSPEELKGVTDESRGEINGGLGLILSYINGGVYVFNAIPNDPGSQAGIRKFDQILKVDNFSLIGLPKSKATKEAADHILGTIGTKVNLLIKRPGVAKPFSVTAVRSVANLYPVEYELFPHSIGYINILTFNNGQVYTEFDLALKQLMNAGVKGLIVDLRGNGGGYVNQVLATLSLLLPPGTTIMGEISKNKSAITKIENSAANIRFYKDQIKKPLNSFNIPIAVLTDGGSASGSEIFSSAIKERGRGITIGEKTAGALEEAVMFPLPDKTAIEVTICFLVLPMADGQFKPIEKIGVSPTIPVKLSGADFSRGKDSQLDAAMNYLENLNKNNLKK